MSLRWDTTKCNPPEPKDDHDRVLRDAIVWASIPAKMGEINSKNWQEFFCRAHYAELHTGAYRQGPAGPVFFQPEEVQRWIGLKTNVITESRAAWVRTQAQRMREEITQEMRKLQKGL